LRRFSFRMALDKVTTLLNLSIKYLTRERDVN